MPTPPNPALEPTATRIGSRLKDEGKARFRWPSLIFFSLDAMHSRTITLALIVYGLAACESMWPPVPAEEQAGYKAAAPVIASLEKFRQQHGRYPAALRELVPRYIRDVRQIAFSSPGDDTNAFQYNSKDDRYSLNFGYFTGGK